jgi:AraC-like DNA-binding protein
LGERYGLSKSHFNRLCREVLGNGVKHELRLWRATEAMLEVFDRREALTAIAYDHGFSSPSHFSREVKELFGVSPRRFHARLE